MNLDNLAYISANIISKNKSLDSPSINFIKQKLQNGSEFYKNIKNQNVWNYFANGLERGEINPGDVTMEQSEKSDYWNREDISSFLYTAKILPEVQKKYPDAYKYITKGDGILPSGLDNASKRDKDKPTIWNVVEKVDKSKDEDDDEEEVEISTPTKRKSDKFFDMPKEKQAQLFKDNVKIDGKETLSGKQASAVAQYVRNILRDM